MSDRTNGYEANNPQEEQWAQGAAGYTNGHNGNAVQKPKISFWTIADLLWQRWYWLVLGTLLAGGGFYYLGTKIVKPKFTATAQLLRYDNPDANSTFKLTPMTPETFSGVIKSPELLDQVGRLAKPPLPADKVAKIIKIDPEPDSDLVKISLAATDREQAANMLNAYLTNIVHFTTELQRNQARKVADEYLQTQKAQLDRDIEALEKAFNGRHLPSEMTNKLNEISNGLSSMAQNMGAPRPSNFLIQKQNEQLEKATMELNELLGKYTEIHPSVQSKQQEIAALQKRLSQYSTNDLAQTMTPAARAAANGGFDPELEMIRMKMLALQDGRVTLVNRQREAQIYAADPPGMVRIWAPANPKTVEASMRTVKISIVAIFGAFVGLAGSLCLVLLVEFADNRLKTPDDIHRVTKLPVLTTLGDLRHMKPEDRTQWAFRTWTMLQGKLSPTPNHGLVCGITSSRDGEGRSTWISLLAEAASLSGFRVLTIATKPSSSDPSDQPEPEQLSFDGASIEGQINPAAGTSEAPEVNANGQALTNNVLTSPAQVTEQLTGPNSQPMVHIPLPGWVWNLDRRKQWRDALTHWKKIDNLVILVELPPASVSEAVLLGCNLPNLLWLSDSGTAHAGETRAQLQTLRDARCNLVGAVLNRESAVPVKRRFPRWLECLALAGFFCAWQASAATPEASPEPALPAAISQGASPDAASESSGKEQFFSVVSPAQRAGWQQHLTLGPGDSLNFGIYGQPELNMLEVVVGPDGRISYQGVEIVATGLTIDELRQKFDEELAKYFRSPRTIITPVAFRSKKYYMLGKVMTKGVYILDRPITVLEAIARAHGLENGLVDRNVVDLADFQRSFLMRNGKRIPLNFEKLFQQGDLSQNIPIEPGDYIFFPSTNIRQVYVVGEVRLPGAVDCTGDMSIIRAISARGGYSDRAYKAKVLVVRGSINNPETIAVDTHGILTGKVPDFMLKPKDIVYVNSRPFIRVEELADLAATAFMQSLVATWTGLDVVKPQ